MTSASSLAGVVLAGGASSRFGRDKADEIWRGSTLLDWSIAELGAEIMRRRVRTLTILEAERLDRLAAQGVPA